MKKGFTLVETLVALGVLGIFFAGMTAIFQQILENVGQSRVRTTALALAQEKMELIKNLPYTSIGTVGGIPQGLLPQQETTTINNQQFTITTSIIYIDDPFDSLAPTDIINTDYKRVRVEITWGGSYPSRVPLTLVTNIVPKGVETVSGGTLDIRVFNANAEPVQNATVTIKNATTIPPIDMQTLTNSNGLVIIPGAPACVTCYEIIIKKQNYSTDKTYSSTVVANPLQPFTTVIEGKVTQTSFSIDQVSSLTVQSFGLAESGYPPVANVQFTLRGSKLIGHDTLDNPVYKYQFTTNTGGGSVSIPSLEWDTYTLDFTNSLYNLGGSIPTMPFLLNPSSSLTIPIVVVPKTNTSLLVTVKNSENILQASATAQLENQLLSYDTTKITASTGSADYGQVFFGGLTPATYTLHVNLPGYQEASSTLNLSGAILENIRLNLMQ